MGGAIVKEAYFLLILGWWANSTAATTPEGLLICGFVVVLLKVKYRG